MKDVLDEMMEMFDKAKLEQSKHCKDGGEHDFQAVMHTDGQDSYSWYFKCSKCGEYVKKTEARKGINKKQWAN